MDPTTSEPTIQREFPCVQCGAHLVFAPGTAELACPHCGTRNRIAEGTAAVEECDYAAALAELAAGEPLQETLAVKCSRCGAESTLPPNVTADKCPFCGSAIVAEAASRKLIRPRSMLPFHITREQAQDAFRQWIASLWFAPSALRRVADAESISGIYMPAWTYNSDTTSRYTGQRGDDYWETETYWDTEFYTENLNGQSVTRARQVQKTRQVRKTRWTSVRGQVGRSFVDLLVRASNSLPEQYFNALQPWDLNNLVPYKDEYLAGFVTESYQVDLPTGFEQAKEDMQEPIRQTIRADIGGDHQRISSVSTRYFNITFKHLLLPLWLSAYAYADRSHRFMVNARTGEVQGERPYSYWKIAFTVLVAIAAVATTAILMNLPR
ncbi:MAG TPA: hypothetical protein PKY77_07990 [Phycisphaerae bacterium]|nr:hypothetical protein [Phycisphaerae bacterium]HRY66497.1 hypothetical protein [Phycisphaerae bacterium]HSA30088.1 hypothetical protein [Phycisphaerae bacterium]